MGNKTKLYISVPVNVSRALITDLKQHCTSSEVSSSSKKYYADDLTYLQEIKGGRMDRVPDMIVTIRPEILWERTCLAECGHFDRDYRYPVHGFMESKGFLDNTWTLKPVFIMPLVIFFNTRVKNPPTTWTALLEPRFKGRILCTHEQTPPAALFRQFCIHSFGARGRDFVKEAVHYRGLPLDVNVAVGKGEYDIGIMPTSFAKFSRDKSTGFSWPEEGAIPLMEIMLLKKDCGENAMKAAEFLLSEKTQQALSRNAGFIPVNPAVALPGDFQKNHMNLLWKGWDTYLGMGPERLGTADRVRDDTSDSI